MAIKKHIHRREFLKRIANASIASASAFATFSSLNMMNAMAANTSGYKALVCLFLHGGNDSFNMVIPRSNAEYSEYASLRTTMAIPKNGLLPISPIASNGSTYGFHPSMTHAKSLFDNGNLGIVANVGALVQPTRKQDYQATGFPLPPHLFSHNDQQAFWQRLDTGVGQPAGWAGRMADLLQSANQNRNLPMNISLTGGNTLQIGISTTPYHLARSGVIPAYGMDIQRRIDAVDALLSNSSEYIFVREHAKIKRRALDLSVEVSEALTTSQPITTPFSFQEPNNLATPLKTVAKIIAARNQLSVSRQIFFIGVTGWDTHNEQLLQHASLLRQLSEGLNAFYNATVELGVENQVTTFTASDFGRALVSNGNGTDHGWGSHHLVMGGAVKGNHIYGEMPSHSNIIGSNAGNNELDIGHGRIIPTTSADQYAATLAHWFGLSTNETLDIFPNLSNFNTANIGFMA